MNLSSVISAIALVFLPTNKNLIGSSIAPSSQQVVVLASKEYSLEKRYQNSFVNDVFRDNILLTLSYMEERTIKGEKVDWDKVRSEQEFRFVLEPGATFAFHEQVEKKYEGKIAQTMKAHFNGAEGFRSDGLLVGDGVCHLASFMNVVAREAGLTVESPTRHDFAVIPEVSRELGTSIKYLPSKTAATTRQNLYVTNNKEKKIAFVFTHENEKLKVAVELVGGM